MSDSTRPRLWGLGALALALHWVEELLSLVNGPVLMVGAAIALVDLLTDGALTVAVPVLLFTWAISQALGIDTQLLGCFARARDAQRDRAWWAVVGWLVLGLLLGYFGWQAGYVFAVQQAEHISEARALAQLGLPPAIWLGERAALAVGLVALSGWTRYHPPAKDAASRSLEDAEHRRLRQEDEIAQAMHKARMRAVQAAGVRQGLAALTGRADPLSPAETDEPDDPGDGGLPMEATGTDGPITGPQRAIQAGRGRPTPLRGIPRNLITAPALAAYLDRELSVVISGDEALAFVRAQTGAARLTAVRGQPWAAPKAATLARARAKWQDRATIRLEA